MATVNKDFRVKNNINLSNTADTATVATHYFIETASDGVIRPKTLANVKSEIVTIDSVNVAIGYATTATSGGTTTLSASSAMQQFFTGTSDQTIVLPVTSTLNLGYSYVIHNRTNQYLTVNSSGGNTVYSIPEGLTSTFTCILTSGTTASSWSYNISAAKSITGTGNAVFSNYPVFTGGPVTMPSTNQFGASITLPHGTAPTSPNNGDVWTTTAGMYVRINGSTIGPLGTGGGGGTTEIFYQTTAPASPSVGNIWVDSDETYVAPLNSNDYVLKVDVLNPFLLAGL